MDNISKNDEGRGYGGVGRWVPLVAMTMCLMVMVCCSEEDPPVEDPPEEEPEEPNPKSSAKALLTFAFEELRSDPVQGIVNEGTKTVAVSVVAELTYVFALKPTITVSPLATVSPASGVAQNFTSPVTYTVTAEDGTQQAYVVTVTRVKALTCRPSEFPGFRERTRVPFYTDEPPYHVDYAIHNAYSGDEPTWASTYAYGNGRVTRIDYEADEGPTGYSTFSYSNDMITEAYYELEDHITPHPVRGFTYYITDDRITSVGYLNSAGQEQAKDYFHYDAAGNVIRTDWGEGGVNGYELYEHDSAVNVYKQTGVIGRPPGQVLGPQFFSPYVNMSRNNVTKITVFFGGEFNVTEEYTYTYDETGLIPLTRTWALPEGEQTYEYNCDE